MPGVSIVETVSKDRILYPRSTRVLESLTSDFVIVPYVAGGEARGDGSGKPTSKRRSRVVHVTFGSSQPNSQFGGEFYI